VTASRTAVLDTNVWLDIHFFRDPAAQSLAGALDSPHCLNLNPIFLEITNAQHPNR